MGKSNYSVGSKFTTKNAFILDTEEAVLVPSVTDSQFGRSVDADDTFSRVIVGSPGVNRAYIFRRDGTTWTEEATLVSSDGLTGVFGDSVGMDGTGTRIICHASTPAKIFIFVRDGTTWTEEAIFTASVNLNLRSRHCVALNQDGTRAIYGNNNNATSSSVKVFVRDGTTWTQEFTVSGDKFGETVDINDAGDTIVFINSGENSQLRVYRRTGTTWTLQYTSGSTSPGTKVSLSADGNTATRGASGGTNDNIAYTYKYNGTSWSLHSSIKNPTSSNSSNNFGDTTSLSAAADKLLVTSNNIFPNNWVAFLYLFVNNAWSLVSSYQFAGSVVASATLANEGTRMALSVSSTVKIFA